MSSGSNQHGNDGGRPRGTSFRKGRPKTRPTPGSGDLTVQRGKQMPPVGRRSAELYDPLTGRKRGAS